MRKKDMVLEIKDLVVHYETDQEVVEAVNNISFSIRKGEVFGLVGETGAGKTTTALSIIGLLQKPPANIIQGSIKFDGEELLNKTNKQMRLIRGDKISMIFQDPMTALNPLKSVGEQIAEVVQLHNNITKKGAMEKAKEMLKVVGLMPDRYKDYPHQFSGGMKQRIVIAIALACEPELLIADQPTTALDVTIQAQVLELMKDLQKEKNTAMIMITHDFGVVADICENCAVMYAGEIVEIGTTEQIFDNPQHPYTKALFAAIPSLDKEVERLNSIPGLMCDPSCLPPHCTFVGRCEEKTDACILNDSKMVEVEPGHFVKCLNRQSGGL